MLVAAAILGLAQAQPVPPIVMTPWPPVISPPAPPMAPRARSRHAAPFRSIVTLITADDYPVAAMDNDQQGAVVASVEVSVAGRVTACTITDSSGWPILDAATCRIIRARARFRPALDERGNPVPGQWTQRVRWEMQAMPFAPLERTSRIATGPAGAILTCEGSDDCGVGEPGLDEAWRTLTGRAPPPARELVVERRFDPGEHAIGSVGKAKAGEKSIFAGRVRVGINYNGKVTRCVPLPGGFGRSDNLCSLVSPWLFKLGPEKGQTRTGVWSFTLRQRPAGAGAAAK